MELGLCTFGELTPDPITGRTRFRDLVEEIVLADQVGLDVFGVGEQHRVDEAVSGPAVVLAAAAEKTGRIRLQGAVTVTRSEDPVRILDRFLTLDALCRDRVEIVAAGNWDVARPPMPVWIAVGDTPESAVRAGMLGLPMALAIADGRPERFVRLVDVFRRTARAAGHIPAPAVSINSPGYVAETSRRATDEASRELRGADFVGSATEVAEAILWQHERFGHQRFLLQVIGGGMPHAQVMRSIELFGTEVAPLVRRALEIEAAAPV